MGAAAGAYAAQRGLRPRTRPAAQFADASKQAIAAWRTPGVLDAVMDAGAGPMPGQVYASINLIDTATHTWDLAKATGQPAALPDDVAAAAYEATLAVVRPELRRPFADEVVVGSGCRDH